MPEERLGEIALADVSTLDRRELAFEREAWNGQQSEHLIRGFVGSSGGEAKVDDSGRRRKLTVVYQLAIIAVEGEDDSSLADRSCQHVRISTAWCILDNRCHIVAGSTQSPDARERNVFVGEPAQV